MTLQTKIHDGVVAVLNLTSVLLAVLVHPLWWLLAAAVGLIMLSSLVTGFCPVHWTVGKLFPPKAV